MEFLSLELSGFKSYGPEPSKLPLNNDGVNQIAGTNGTGKTNIVDGFLWVLTDKTIKLVKVDQVVNWHLPHGQGAEGILLFKADDGHVYEARRYRKHPKYKNDLLLFQDGVLLETEEVKVDPQAVLERITGLSYDELVGSLVFSAEDFKSFIEKKPDEKREFAETFFRIDRFRKPAEIARKERLETKRKIDSGKDIVDAAVLRVSNERQRLEQSKEDVMRWGSEQRLKLDGFTQEHEQLSMMNPEAGLEQLEKIDAAQQVINSAETDVSRCQNEFNEAQKEFDLSSGALSEEEVNAELQKHETREQIQQQVNAAQQVVGSAEKNISKCQEELDEAQKQFADLSGALSEEEVSVELQKCEAREQIQQQIDVVERECQNAESQIKIAQAELQSATQAEKNAQGYLNSNQRFLQEATSAEQNAAIPRAQKAQKALQTAKDKLQEANQPDCPYCGQTLPEHMVTPEEIERRSNSLQQDFVLAQEEAKQSAEYLQQSMDSKKKAADLVAEYESQVPIKAEERQYAAEALGDAHNILADFKVTLCGDADTEPPLIGLQERLTSIPLPKLPKEQLQEQRTMAARCGDAERLVDKRKNDLSQAQGALQQANIPFVGLQERLTLIPLPKLSKEQLQEQRTMAARHIDAERLVDKRKNDLSQAQDVFQEANIKLQTLPSPEKKKDELEQAKTRLVQLDQLILSAKNEVNPHQETVVLSEKRIVELQAELDKEQQKLSKNEELHPHLEALVRAFERDLPQAILRQLLPRFNAYLQGYLDNLLPGCTLSFNEALQDYLIYEGKEVEAKQLSTGQRARINFAICMSTFSTMMWERGRVTNVAFFDEVLDLGLDDAGRLEAFDLIKGLPMTIFIITHNATLREEFDEIYEVQRQLGGFSKLVSLSN